MRSSRHSPNAGAPEPADLQRTHEQWYREADLPLYGLSAEHDCARMIGDANRVYRDDHDGRGPQLVGWESLGLGHGNPISNPWLHVITATTPGPALGDLMRDDKLRQQPNASLSTSTAIATTILIDHEPVDFVGLESTDCWVVHASHAGYIVSVVGARWPRDGLELVRIEDPEPYLTGRAEFLRTLRDHSAE